MYEVVDVRKASNVDMTNGIAFIVDMTFTLFEIQFHTLNVNLCFETQYGTELTCFVYMLTLLFSFFI